MDDDYHLILIPASVISYQYWEPALPSGSALMTMDLGQSDLASVGGNALILLLADPKCMHLQDGSIESILYVDSLCAETFLLLGYLCFSRCCFSASWSCASKEE